MICSQCKKEVSLDGFYKNKLGKRAYSWCKSCHNLRQTEYEVSPRGKYTELKKDAKKRGLAFLLTLEEVTAMWRGDCRYCGNTLKFVSLDRVDNEKPYTLENTIPCCRWCNYTKGTGSSAFFYAQCKRVVDTMPIELSTGDEWDVGARYEGQLKQKQSL
jgi:hypothetical protein